MNLANYIYPFHSPYELEDNDVFDEEFVVDNLGCSCKMKTIVKGKRNLSYCLSKSTDKKEVYLIHFHGRWEELKWTLKTICDAGLTFYRNVHFYTKNKTRLLAMDFDGKEDEKYGLNTIPAECLIWENNFPSTLVIPSARCNYVPGSLDEYAIKKYHVFTYTKPYDCTKPKNIADLSDRFSMYINNYYEPEDAKEFFPWDKSAMSPWLRFFSKSKMTAEEIGLIQTINVRFRNETGAIFEYRNFTQIFSKDFLTVTKCDHYVPNANGRTCNNVVPYCVPPFGFNEPDKPKEPKKVYRDFWKELLEFAGLTSPGIYNLPHYHIGRLNNIKTSQRNIIATKTIWGIAFNIYAAERFCGKTMDERKVFALAWFNSIFNGSNVEDYAEFMDGFNPDVEYIRKNDDTYSLERHYEYPEGIEESKFCKTVKIGFGGAFNIESCSTRNELEMMGMSERTVRRNARKLGLGRKEHKQHKSKLDKYAGLTEAELDELVKKGELNRMAKHRIIERRNKQCL